MSTELQHWEPACGGTEKPFMCKGEKLIYMWNRVSREYRHYNISKDKFLEPDEIKHFGLHC